MFSIYMSLPFSENELRKWLQNCVPFFFLEQATNVMLKRKVFKFNDPVAWEEEGRLLS